MIGRPERGEVGDYYFTYIDKVGDGDIRRLIAGQTAEALALFDSISEEQSLHRYAPAKWSIREVLGHINDCERLFTFRAFWFARALAAPLPSFDQDEAAAAAGAHDRSWRSHVEEFRAVRAATEVLFAQLPDAAWSRRGVASGNPASVRSLAYITAGHVTHHLSGLREQYLGGGR